MVPDRGATGLAFQPGRKSLASSPSKVCKKIKSASVELSSNLQTPPKATLRQVLGSIIGKAIGDVQTKEVQVFLSMPALALERHDGMQTLRLHSVINFLGGVMGFRLETGHCGLPIRQIRSCLLPMQESQRSLSAAVGHASRQDNASATGMVRVFLRSAFG